MKADNTRSTFNSKKHYRGVHMQQGRVQLDADWNEQMDIISHRVETEANDVVGHCGIPILHAGFHLVANAADLTDEEKALPENQNPPALKPTGDFYISGGRLYLDGILCQNECIVPFTMQPDLPGVEPVKKNGTYLIYLDVWSRHITALEDPEIKEIALGGPDTATRTKTVWQVNYIYVGDVNAEVNCLSLLPDWNKLIESVSGKLAAQAEKSTDKDEPCILVPGAGFRRLENQLYRVEVHSSGNRGIATFKWSRDNGSIVAQWGKQDGNKLTVSSIGRDKVLNFASGQWVELIDDDHELKGEPGILVKIQAVEGNIITIDPNTSTPKGSIKIDDFKANPKVRRWDSDGEVKPTNSDWLSLEDGIQVKFTTGYYRTGDYWLVPARTATADVEWPESENPNQPLDMKPHGIRHHYCKLGVLKFDKNNGISVQDCRKPFPPVTKLTSLFYVCGDGQEAMPGQKLPQTLRVRVANGQLPVINAKVLFNVISEAGTQGGTLSTSAPVSTTAPHGIAECEWTLGVSGKQQVEAWLLDAAGQHVPGQVLRFNANLSIASEVEYNPDACIYLKDKGAKTVQKAIDELCIMERRGGCAVTVGTGGQFGALPKALGSLLEEGKTDICICLLPGDHDLPDGLSVKPNLSSNINIKITGCGPGTRIHLKKPWHMEFVTAFTLRDIAIDLDSPWDFMMFFTHCPRVTIESCSITGITKDGFLLAIKEADHIRLNNNVIETFQPKSLKTPTRIFKQFGAGLSELFNKIITLKDFNLKAIKIVEELPMLDVKSREDISNKIVKSVMSDDKLKVDEKDSYTDFAKALSARTVNKELLLAEIKNIRRVDLVTSPGNAVAIMDGDADVALENNDITGVVSLYGLHVKAELKEDELKILGALIKHRAVVLIGSTGRLQMLNNRFTGLFVADDLINRIREIIKAEKGTLESIFKDSFINDNLIDGGQNQFVSQHMFLNSNSFATGDPLAGTAITDSVVFIGNQANKEIRLNNVSQDNQKAANLKIDIRDWQ